MIELERLAAEASVLAGGDHPCEILGHVWAQTGGAWCGCPDGSCSIPVCHCLSCSECDYGENTETEEIRETCKMHAEDLCSTF